MDKNVREWKDGFIYDISLCIYGGHGYRTGGQLEDAGLEGSTSAEQHPDETPDLPAGRDL